MSAEGREPVASCHRDEEGLPVVQLRGEIEAFHADWLGRALAAALEEDPPRIVIDLSETSFLAGAAARRIADMSLLLPERNCSFVLRNPRGIVRRVLEVTGVDGGCVIESSAPPKAGKVSVLGVAVGAVPSAARPQPGPAASAPVLPGWMVEAFEMAPVMVTLTEGPEHRMVWRNRLAVQVLGSSGMGRPLRDSYGGDRPSLLERWDRAGRGERVTIVEPVTGPEDVAGRSRVVRRSLSPVRGVDGIPVGVIEFAAETSAASAGRFRAAAGPPGDGDACPTAGG